MSAIVKEIHAKRGLKMVSAAKLAEPLPEAVYLVNALGLAAGAVSIFAGFGYSGKSVALQSMALSVAAGTDLWGVFRTTQGRVVHIDGEQGFRLTAERYQRLALAAGLDLAGLPLEACTHPDVNLEAPNAEDVYCRAFDGAALAFVDSFRALCPTTDENSSESRRYLDLLSRASERTGAAVLAIHHSKKPNGENAAARYALRGSGAFYDAASSVFVLSGDEAGKVHVQHTKDRNRGTPCPDFGLAIEDVALAGNPRAGLRVRHLESAQLAGVMGPGPVLEASMRRVVEFIESIGGEFKGGLEPLRESVKMRKADLCAALSALQARGLVVEGRGRPKPLIVVPSGSRNLSEPLGERFPVPTPIQGTGNLSDEGGM